MPREPGYSGGAVPGSYPGPSEPKGAGGQHSVDIRKVAPIRVEPSSAKTASEAMGGVTGTAQPPRAPRSRPKEREFSLRSRERGEPGSGESEAKAQASKARTGRRVKPNAKAAS